MNKFKIAYFKPYEVLFPELSDKQLKVFVLYNNNVSIEDISMQLDITNHTVHSYLRDIKKKYNVNSRSELKDIFKDRKDHYIITLIYELAQERDCAHINLSW